MTLRRTLLVVLIFAQLAPAAMASPRKPPGFYGVTIQEAPPTRSDVRKMRRSGVGAVRVAFTWFNQEPQPGLHQWGETDATVGAITRAGARVLPIVNTVPVWVAPLSPVTPPLGSPFAEAAWQSHLQALASRYGPGGTYAATHPAFKPIRTWQLWNEENLTAYWGSFPDPPAYARLVELGAAALRSVDPSARVMIGGLSTANKGIDPSRYLKRLYEASGPDPSFDIVALHPYAGSIAEMVGRIRRSRQVMRDFGDEKSRIAITEAGWGSAGPPGYPPSGTPSSQARMVGRFFDTLERHRNWRITQAFWYAWRDLRREPDHCGFCTFTGLLEADGTPKPALRAFRRSATRR